MNEGFSVSTSDKQYLFRLRSQNAKVDWLNASEIEPCPSHQTPSSSFSVLPGFDEVDLEDLELRKAARILRLLDPSVVTSEKDHPAIGAVCEVCGKGEKLLSHCGRPLCIPCMKKKAGRKAVLLSRALIQIASERQYANVRPGLKLLTLTERTRAGHLKNGVDRLKRDFARLKRTHAWNKVWCVEGVYARMEWTLTRQGWHVHIHAIVVSKFIPAGPDYAKPGEANLRDLWHEITGDSFIVNIQEIEPNPSSIVHEVEKYLVKPISDSDGKEPGRRIQDWDLDTRRELAEVIAGPYRTNWYCPVHHSRSRAKCLDYRPPPGMKAKRRCEGEYRKERQGFRVFVPTGLFREVLRNAREDRTEKHLCRRCGLGRTRARKYWKELEREDLTDNASIALNLIEAHETTDYDSLKDLYLGDPASNMPAGWHPPPDFEGYDPRIAINLSEYLKKEPRSRDWMLDHSPLRDGIPDYDLMLKIIDGQLKVGNWVAFGEFIYLPRRGIE